ncbi:MAG TPA: alpha/beta fold hydrolase, partial [Candidatus Dormibacteraeota bacterium]
MDARRYNPIEAGTFEVVTRTIDAVDRKRGRRFPVEVWNPASDGGSRAGGHPLVLFSHLAGGNRRSSSFLCRHLASHGYAVAALDHSEVIAPELQGGRQGETDAQRAERIDAIIGSRVPDLRFLLDFVLAGGIEIPLDAEAIGLVGHSAGGWTVLATAEVDSRVRSVVALTPGGSSRPRPGVLAVRLAYTRQHQVPTLILAAENDVLTPLDGIEEIFEKTPEPKRMFVLRRADHEHFVDDVEGAHEGLRAMTLPGD